MTSAQPHHAIVRLHVSGGFLADASLQFSEKLNCLIGGRGTGKTTTLEFLRFCLGSLPDPKIYPARRRALESLVVANLGTGRLTVEVRTKTGISYSAERGAGGSVAVRNANGDVVPISLDRDEIFSVDVFSQSEIEEIASNTSAQLELLDRFNEGASRRTDREIVDLERILDQSGLQLRRLDEEIESLRAQASEITGYDEKLKALIQTDGPNAERTASAHEAKSARLREARIPEALIVAIKRVVQDASSMPVAIMSVVDTQLDGRVMKDANQDLLREMRAEMEQFESAVRTAVSTISNAASQAEIALDKSRETLAARHATQEADYSALMAATEEQSARAVEREALQTALVSAQVAHRELQGKSAERENALRIRGDLLRRLSEARDARYNQRRSVAARLSSESPTLRVTVTQGGDQEAYRAFLTEELKGLRLKQGMVADRIISALVPMELASVVHRNAPEELATQTSLDLERAQRIVTALRDTGAAYALELVDLADVPCIELRDGETYKQASRLSTGQRCTAILPILLKQSERPLLIDQPEDNLDNAFVFDAVVTALRSVKHGRQIIFVTHNPNIPVLGDADRVFVFESDGRHAGVAQEGSIDECKDAVERILEGGSAAFIERMKRYGH